MWLISGGRSVNRLCVLLLTLLVLSGCGQADVPVASAPPTQPLAVGGTLPVQQIPGGILTDPGSVAWNQLAEHSLELSLAPPVHPSVNLRHEAVTPPVVVC